MKVGTDGVLLGAWCPLDSLSAKGTTGESTRILDIGTGSGLIARMLIQRCPQATVEGIDIDEAAVGQARENGIQAFCSSLQEWKPNDRLCPETTNNLYDLIVSNPPYFQNSLKNPDPGRQAARHTDSLSYAELIAHSARLLASQGQLALILPADAESEVRALADAEGLRLTRLTHVYSKESKPARRVLMAFRLSKSQPLDVPPQEDILVLENEIGGRSAAYQELCKEFYL